MRVGKTKTRASLLCDGKVAVSEKEHASRRKRTNEDDGRVEKHMVGVLQCLLQVVADSRRGGLDKRVQSCA